MQTMRLFAYQKPSRVEVLLEPVASAWVLASRNSQGDRSQRIALCPAKERHQVATHRAGLLTAEMSPELSRDAAARRFRSAHTT